MASPEQDDLLADVLADATPAEFEAAVLAESIRCAKQRRRRRRVGRSVAALAASVVLAFFSARFFRPTATHRRSNPPAYTVVRTQPLSAAQVVHTGAVHGARLVESVSEVAVVHTQRGGFRPIGDQELLAILAPRPVLLVKEGPGREALVFADTP